jgi:hypothetical protein
MHKFLNIDKLSFEKITFNTEDYSPKELKQRVREISYGGEVGKDYIYRVFLDESI